MHIRPREKLLEKGPQNLHDYELLAILLRTGVTGKSAIDVAKEILKKYPITQFLDVTFEDLKKIKGVDKTKIATLLAAFELTKRAVGKLDTSLPVIDSPQKAVDQLTEIRDKKKEHFVVMYLNARKQLVHKETISVGTIDSALAHPREVFEPAIRYLASSVILAHNHPSGDVSPSPQDIDTTKNLKAAGEILGIEVLDHVILTGDKFFSLHA